MIWLCCFAVWLYLYLGFDWLSARADDTRPDADTWPLWLWIWIAWPLYAWKWRK